MPPLTRPKAIIFDMDGLMLDSESIYHLAWQQAVTSLGYEFDSQLYLSLVGHSNVEAEQLMGQFFGDTFPFQTFRTAWTAYWHEHVQNHSIPVKSGLLELLDLLESYPIPKAVGTSSNLQEAEISLKGANLWHRFAHVVTVDQVAAGKPAPDIFLRAVQKLGVPPGDCLVLEDSNAGVKAASTAGIPVIMVPDLQPPSPEAQRQVCAIATSLHKVCDFLKPALSGSDTKSE
ncbi:MAG: HAD family phosphatase [Cyanobacteria bacterium P01_A01_bin.114]